MNTVPQEWIKAIESAVKELQSVPLWGNPPPFPWEELSLKLQEELELPELALSFHQIQSVSDPLEGFGKDAHIVPIELTPLSEKAFWIMSASDEKELTKICLSPQKPPKGFSDPKLQEGFSLFLDVSAIDVINSLSAFDDLSLTMGKIGELPSGSGLGIDLSLKIRDKTLWARVFCPASFHRAFSSHFSTRPFSIAASPFVDTLDVELSLKVGSCTLSSQEWEKVKTGDLVLLEHCNFHPEKREGILTINLGDTPLFQGNYRDGAIKILEYAFYYEEGETMQDEFEEKEEGKEEIEEDSEHMWETSDLEAPIENAVSLQEVPIVLTVEIGRLRMKLNKLLQLQPGNVLELSRKPEQGVDITVNGKKVAKAEIIQIGEALGLKILEIG